MPALSEFADGLRRCRLLRDIENTYPDPPVTAFDQHSVEALRASMTVLMVASFEEFIRTAFREALSLLSRATSGNSASDYHEGLRDESAYSGVSLAHRGAPGGTARTPQRFTSIVQICDTIVKDDIVVEALSSVDSNPNGKRLQSMLERVGIEDVKNSLHRRYQARFGFAWTNFLLDRLDSIVSSRHVVAHSGRGLTVSRSDLNANLILLEQAAEVIDSILSDFVVAAKLQATLPIKARKLRL